jgi:type 1 glutamine amidotransferase
MNQRNLIVTFSIVILVTILMSMTKPPTFRAMVILSRAADHIKMMTSARPFLERMAQESNFVVDITDDTSQLNDTNLAQFQVVIQLQQAPFDMSQVQQDALQRFIMQGKGWVGIHAAGLTGRDFVSPSKRYWQWF